jgi:hypothetical protein
VTQEAGLGVYAKRFAALDVDGRELATYDEAKLMDFGMTSPGC